MTRKPTPRERFEAARQTLRDAYERCPHWDYEDGGQGHDCCDDVEEAKYELDQARKRNAESADQVTGWVGLRRDWPKPT